MRIVIVAPGSQGDVQPYIALGKGLKKAGNTVRLVSNLNYESLVKAHDLEFWPVESNMREIIENEKMREVLERGSLITSMAQMGKVLRQNAVQLTSKTLAAAQGTDMVIAGISGLFVGLSIAEKLDLPFIQAYNVPFTPTREFPGALMSNIPFLPANSFNRFTHHLTRQIVWQTFRSTDKVVRQTTLGLPGSPLFGLYKSSRLSQSTVIYGISPSVIKRPADWDENVHMTGYWFLEPQDEWNPPLDLTEFLNNGTPPIYIGFGSMSNRRPEETAKMVLQATKLARQRAVIFSGWSGLRQSDLPDSVFMVDYVPHAWLFPRMGAVIHHGGAGTTAAGFKAGIPSIIIPFHGDQPFWGKRVTELGVGPKPIPRKKVTAERLASTISEAVTDLSMRRRASELGAKIRAEDGVSEAVAIIQKNESKSRT